MSAANDHCKHFVPVPRPHCQQIMGIVGAASWRRDIRNGTFDYCLFLIEAVGTESVSLPKPVSFALCAVDRSHGLSKLLFAIHPPAQFLSPVLVNDFDLIFITVVVRHLFSPLRQALQEPIPSNLSTTAQSQLCGAGPLDRPTGFSPDSVTVHAPHQVLTARLPDAAEADWGTPRQEPLER